MPRPDTSLTFSAVLRPGSQINCCTSRGVIRSASAAEVSARSTAFARMRSVSSPCPSSDTRMMILLPRWKASSEIVPCAGLPGGRASFRRLDAVVGGVADHVNHRIAQLVDHPFVEFRAFAADFQPNVFSVDPRQVADHAMEPVEQRPDRQHSHVHHALLNAVAGAVKQMNRLEQIGDAVVGLGKILLRNGRLQLVADLRDPGLADRQLPGQIHQFVEPFDVDPQRLGRLRAGLDAAAVGCQRGCGERCALERLDRDRSHARHLQQTPHGLRALVGGDAEFDQGDVFERIDGRLRRIQVANVAHVRQLAAQQLRLQAGQRQIRPRKRSARSARRRVAPR